MAMAVANIRDKTRENMNIAPEWKLNLHWFMEQLKYHREVEL